MALVFWMMACISLNFVLLWWFLCDESDKGCNETKSKWSPCQPDGESKISVRVGVVVDSSSVDWAANAYKDCSNQIKHSSEYVQFASTLFTAYSTTTNENWNQNTSKYKYTTSYHKGSGSLLPISTAVDEDSAVSTSSLTFFK